MAMLTERLTYDQARITLETQTVEGKPKNLFMSGIFIQGGVKNLNERVYPVNEITKAVESINTILQRGESVLGEADHPEELNINLDRVSHMVTQMWVDGPCGMGKLQIVETPMGQIIRTLLEAGAKLGVSSRGSGNVNESGMVSDFELVTMDIVARPSAPDAYPRPVYETRNSRRGHIIEDLSHAVINDPKAQKYLKRELLEWIGNLRA